MLERACGREHLGSKSGREHVEQIMLERACWSQHVGARMLERGCWSEDVGEGMRRDRIEKS